ncbi:MAG: ATP-binding protein [Armatimonadota bacterium]
MNTLWPDLDPEAAGNNLRQTVHSARRTLHLSSQESEVEAQIASRDQILALEPSPWVDVIAFEHAAAAALATRDLHACEEAARLYAGELLPDDRYDEWVIEPRAALQQQYIALLLELAKQYEARGDCAQAAAAFLHVIGAEPAHETAHVGLMRLHAASGRRHEALERYRILRETMKRDLDAEPGEEARRVYDAIRTHESISAPKHLPVALTSFVGRERELADLAALIARGRLVTITGPAGFGKTRLALEVARAAQEFPHGVWWIDLAGLRDPHLVPQAVAAAVGAQDLRSPVESLAAHLESKRALLVLDNCEHLLDACARFLGALLRACPDVRALATSRERLNVQGEILWRVPPMQVPAADTPLEEHAGQEAIRLFVERARAVRPGFALTPDNARAIGELCRRLDGMPLGIELAAARVRHLTAEQILARLHDRFHLLVGLEGDTRHRTLEGAIAWSYDLLVPAERLLFTRVSIFPGSYSLEAAEAICGGDGLQDADVLHLLADLIDKSLVVTEERRGGRIRYRLLETLREYGRQRLDESGETERMRGALAHYCLALVERVTPLLVGPQHARWLDLLEEEIDALRAAMAWATEHDRGLGLRIAAGLERLWEVRGYSAEGRDWLTRLLERNQDVPDVRAMALALNTAGRLAIRQGQHSEARARLEESLRLWRSVGEELEAAMPLSNLGLNSWHQGALVEARDFYEQALALRRKENSQAWIAVALSGLGLIARDQGDYTTAVARLSESLSIFRGLDERFGMAMALVNLADTAQGHGDMLSACGYAEQSVAISREVGNRLSLCHALFVLANSRLSLGHADEARALYQESLALARELGDQRGVAFALSGLGDVARVQGDYPTASQMYTEGITAFAGLGERLNVADSLERLAALALACGQMAGAVRIAGAATAIREAIGAAPVPVLQVEVTAGLAAAREALGENAYADAWAEGRRMTLEEAVACALPINA